MTTRINLIMNHTLPMSYFRMFSCIFRLLCVVYRGYFPFSKSYGGYKFLTGKRTFAVLTMLITYLDLYSQR